MSKFQIKKRYKEWKDQRFLKKHGCNTQEQYDHRYDADVNQRASRINDYYGGYYFVVAVENRDHYAYKLLYDYGPGGYRYGYSDMSDWCKENCKFKFRVDFLRTWMNSWNEWEINEIGGSDYIFFAFKDSEDVTWFRLKWGC